MGGTMDYPRLRNRNALGYRKMGVPDPYLRNDGEAPLITDHQQRMLIGEFNRLEQSYMGEYADIGDQLVDMGVAATGVDKEVIKRVLRWFLGLPESDCADCTTLADRDPHSVFQRCQRHAWGR